MNPKVYREGNSVHIVLDDERLIVPLTKKKLNSMIKAINKYESDKITIDKVCDRLYGKRAYSILYKAYGNDLETKLTMINNAVAMKVDKLWQ